ncbi:hypothetical protein L249_1858 [Ophiocordyceps polyrhachis-furcata BCC 54312]|uniref:Uncharacterized protein n=1 Tax=Ophiocordyceps polyrhachis-furcata BCC 54312 TaxID=1330021 RepID=A0A367LPD0_9HYPO|nr:hypothetical protein L249_1858 [Ophiocordyceps polyrhachis-furcata BCC 54312]
MNLHQPMWANDFAWPRVFHADGSDKSLGRNWEFFASKATKHPLLTRSETTTAIEIQQLFVLRYKTWADALTLHLPFPSRNMKLLNNLLLMGALATSVLSTAIPEMAEEAAVEEGVSTLEDAPGGVFAEARAVRSIHHHSRIYEDAVASVDLTAAIARDPCVFVLAEALDVSALADKGRNTSKCGPNLKALIHDV